MYRFMNSFEALLSIHFLVKCRNIYFFFLITFIGYNTSDDNTYIYMEEK